MKLQKNKIELLAPVGGIDQFFAAVENGADAVYIGGYKFNARMKADNFTIDDLSNAIKYAHLRNVKVYITVNTLLYDNELEAALKYCTELYNIGADGLIVQDLGLAHLVKNHLPYLPLHLSTQGTVYNLSGMNAAESLGFSRVVLARETTLDGIKNITDSSKMEIEIFVHGALCMCYSGQCQMSRVLGGVNGRSGNRGLCAQPCRLPYTSISNDGGHVGNKSHSDYPLSPKDLCSIDCIGEIIEAGVTSLKIEGRMKSPEYVAIITRIYRKYIDEYMSTGTYIVEEKDRHALKQIFSRGDFTTGYLYENLGEKLLTKDIPKHHGVYIGKIVNLVRGKSLIDVELDEPLSIGDGIEIRNKELTGNIVTYSQHVKGNIYRIGDIKGKVEIGQSVYRISQSSLMKEARKTYEGADFVDGKNHKKIPIDIELVISIGKSPTLKIVENDEAFFYNDEELIVEQAINKPLEKSVAERQLRKTGSTCFEVAKVSLNIEDGSILPLSAINKLRRDGLNAYANYKIEKDARASVDWKLYLDEVQRATSNNNTVRELGFYIFETENITNFDFKSVIDLLGVNKAKLYLPIEEFMKIKSTLPEYLEPIPYISNISKGNLDKYIENNFSKIVEAVKETGISIGNLGWCREFASRGITVYADYGLNLNNEWAKAAIATLGVLPTYMSLEAQDESGWPIMITEHPLNYRELIDRKKERYNIKKTASGDKWMLFKTNNGLNNNTLISKWKNTDGELRIYL